MDPSRHPRTIILSDLHLGRPGGAEEAARLLPIVDGCERLILNGDTAELHHGRHRAKAEAELGRLRDLCHARAVRLDLIAGNHDPFVSEVRSLRLLDGAIYLTHGDALHPAIAPWSPHAAVMRAAFERALAQGASRAAAPTEDQLFAAAREAAIAEWQSLGDGAHVSTIANMAIRPHRALAAVAYWRSYPALVRDWAERFAPTAGTVVVGHSHRPFVRTLGGLRIVNTGAYGFPGTPLAALVESGEVLVHRVEERGGRYRLAERPIARWSAAPRGPQPPARADASADAMKPAASASAARSIDVA
jgi:predicted phosphodiesterase